MEADVVLARGTWIRRPRSSVTHPASAPVEQPEMERTVNMGAGMLAVLPADDEQDARDTLPARGVAAWTIGR